MNLSRFQALTIAGLGGILVLGLFGAGCGLIPKGGTSVFPNDVVPNLPVVAQGFFIGLNGREASGTVVIYAQPGANTSILRLSGVTLPDEPGLLIRMKAGVIPVPPVPLRYPTGSQNYTVGVAASQTWDYVTIYSQATTLEYAQAFLR